MRVSEHEQLLEEYMEGIRRLKEATANLSDEALDSALSEEDWTIRQIIHHIADGDDLWKGAIKAAFGSSAPFAPHWYWEQPQERWAERWHYAGRDIAPSLSLLEANRTHICQLIKQAPNGLRQKMVVQWANGAEERGTVADVIKMQIGHVREHLTEILKIRQNLS